MAAKAEKKLAKKLAQEQLLMQMRKDNLVREEALDQVNLSKIKDKWLETLIDTKVPQMQDNLRHILHYMEKLIEAENFRKLLFEDERQELEEKSTLMAQSHGYALETLFDIFQGRVQDLHNAYQELVSEKKTEAEIEFKAIHDHESKTQDNMQTMLFQMQENKEKQEETMNCDMFLKIDDERSKNTELLESLQAKLEKKMENRWGEISSALRNYEETTRARRKDYIVLKAKDDLDSKIIYQQMKKTQKLFEQLDDLQRCIDECYAPKEKISLIKDLREERMKFFNTFKQLKLIVDEELKEDEINLKNLTVITNTLTDEMRKICTKGEQILTMYRICRRLETEYEKIVPLGNPYSLAAVQAVLQKRKKKTRPEEYEIIPAQTESENWTKDIQIFEKFWRKAGKVRLSIMALEKCIETVKKENELLKRILASYLKEVAKTKVYGSERTIESLSNSMLTLCGILKRPTSDENIRPNKNITTQINADIFLDQTIFASK